MDTFVSRFRGLVTGVLSGFDRLVFCGHLTPLRFDGGMFLFLKRTGIRLLDFKHYVVATSEAVRDRSLAQAERDHRPVRYLPSSATSKEDLARTLLAEHPIEQGLVCAFKTVEPCVSFEYHRSKDKNERGLRLRPTKCLHLYKYFLHPVFGFMNVRLQTWFPFDIQVCLNGREWLARQLTRRGCDFKRLDNCFPWIDDVDLAQRLMAKQLETDWPDALRLSGREMLLRATRTGATRRPWHR
jgi:hypothetical protein